MRHTYEYQLGDELTVVGDSARWGHGFVPGDPVRVIDFYSGSSEPGYRCIDKQESVWNIAQSDVELAIQPVTEEELAEVYTLISRAHVDAGVHFREPAPHKLWITQYLIPGNALDCIEVYLDDQGTYTVAARGGYDGYIERDFDTLDEVQTFIQTLEQQQD